MLSNRTWKTTWPAYSPLSHLSLFFYIKSQPMTKFFTFLLFTLCHILQFSSCGKILIIHPLYSGSHVLTLRSVAESLTKHGHQIHIVRWKDAHIFPMQNNPNISITTLAIDNSQGQFSYLTREKQAAFQVPFDVLWNSGLSFKSVLEVYQAFPLMGGHCDALLSNFQLRKQLRKEKYDLAIIDILYNECSLALLHNLKIPSIGYWAFPFASGEADYTTAFLPSSHVPTFLSKLGHEMTFLDRVYNTLMKLVSHAIMWVHCSIVNQYIQTYLPGTPHPFYLLKDMNGMLINTDYALDYPRLLPPTFINVGGMQIQKHPPPLSTDLEEWIDSSGDNGVVLFTMGFIFNPKIVPRVLVNAFMTAFGKLPQKFIVKFEGPMDFVPPNVKVLDFVPQQSILAHPKTRAFLTHCGLHGVMEAIYFGVPMVGVPIFIDQGDVLIKMKEKGIALGFSKDNATADEIYTSLHEVIKNPKYKRNVVKLSQLMRDVNETPLEKVINFVEYLIRHNGAEHLKLSSRHLNSIQYFCLDTIGFLTLCFIIVLYCQYRIMKYIWMRFVWIRIQNVYAQIIKSESFNTTQAARADFKINNGSNSNTDLLHNNNNNSNSSSKSCQSYSSKPSDNVITKSVSESSPNPLKKIL